MPGTFVKNSLKHFFNTRMLADTATYNGQSFGVQFFIEDAPADMFGTIVENSQAYILARTSDVPGIATGIMVVVGSNTATGDGFQNDGDLFVDLGDAWDMSGQTTYYVLKVANYGDDGLIKQIFLSKDKP